MAIVKIEQNRNCVHQTAYHMVFCPKYRRKVLTGRVKERLEGLLVEIARDKRLSVLSLEVMPDRVHLFLSIPPAVAPATAAKWCKGISARKLLMVFPGLRSVCRRDHLWSPSYYVGTAGNVSAETIRRYIEEMQSDKRK